DDFPAPQPSGISPSARAGQGPPKAGPKSAPPRPSAAGRAGMAANPQPEVVASVSLSGRASGGSTGQSRVIVPRPSPSSVKSGKAAPPVSPFEQRLPQLASKIAEQKKSRAKQATVQAEPANQGP